MSSTQRSVLRRRARPTLPAVGAVLMLALTGCATSSADEAGATESGLLFLSFQADIARQLTPMQRRLDNADLLNEWTSAVGSAVFAVLPGFREGGWLGETLLG